MTKFNKKQATFKRPKNFLFAVISCFLLALASPFIIDKIFVSASGTETTTSLVSPQGISELMYSGAEHALVNATNATPGVEWKYAVTESYSSGDQAPSENWSTEIPKRTEAGTYYVWYKVDGGSDYNALTSSAPLEVTIKPNTNYLADAQSSSLILSGTVEETIGTILERANPATITLNNNDKLEGTWSLTNEVAGDLNKTVGEFLGVEKLLDSTQSRLLSIDLTFTPNNNSNYGPCSATNSATNNNVLTRVFVFADPTADIPIEDTITSYTGKKQTLIANIVEEFYDQELGLYTSAYSDGDYPVWYKFKVTRNEDVTDPDDIPGDWIYNELVTATDAGKYKIWWKGYKFLDGFSEYREVETSVCKTPLEITIEKATPNMPENYSSPGVYATAECEKASDIPLNDGTIEHPLDVNGKPLGGQWIWPDNYNENNYSMDQLFEFGLNELYAEFVPNNSNYKHIVFPVIFNGYTASDPKSPSAFSKALIYNGQPQALVDTANATNTVDWQYFYYQKNGDETPTLPDDASWSSEIPTATEIGTYYIWCKADEKALYGQTIYKAYQTPSDKPLIANIKQAIPSVGISSLPTPMAINQNFDINVTAGESSDLVLYEWVKNNITLTPDLKGKFEWDTAPLYFTENTTCQIIFTADNDNDYSKYNWSANNDFIQIVENGKNAVRLAHDINIKVTPRAGWGTPIIREPDKALQWVEPSGRTSIEISGKYVNKYDILWLLEESDGTKAWYGLDLSNNAFDLNKNLRFYVHWIGPNDKYYKTYYDKLDDSTKKSVENNNGWIFLIGVMDKNGNKIEPNKESLPVKVYVQIGDDWNLDNLKGYFIQEGTDEPVKVTHQRMLYPESKGIDDKYMDDFGVMEMYHFSPYFIYDELTNIVQTGDIVNPTLIYTILVVALIAISLFIWLNFKKYKESKNK